MYTYVLKDLVQGIYKIGKTTSPSKRFNTLCVLGRVVPIALVEKDVEAELHKKFADNRVVNDQAQGGKTEWFRPGGKIDKFISRIDTGGSIPYITVVRMVNHLLDAGALKYKDASVQWEIDQSETGKFYIGLEILYRAGFAKAIKPSFISANTAKVTVYKDKIAVSECTLRHIIDTHEIHVFSDCVDVATIDNPKEAPIRKVRLDHICNAVVLVITK